MHDTWYAAPADDALAALATCPGGLDPAEAQQRLALHGANQLPRARPRTALQRLLRQFHDVLIYVLLAAAVLAAVIDHGVDALVILGVVLINAAIGFIQEGRAQHSLEALQTMISPRASLLRGGRRITVAVEQIVPGDLVLLEPGDRVPADLRLLSTLNLRIEEAALTGESVAVLKDPAPAATDAVLGDRTSMAYSGTLVAAGQGTGVAIATGTHTELGRIGALLGSVESLRTPLTRQMDRFARQLTSIILGIAALVLLFAHFVRGYPLAEAFMIVVGVAVAAIPEGLPAVMTITLAIGVRRMAARNAIVRRLPAVEALGAVTIICTDKTGTLTRNEMTASTLVTAEDRIEVTGAGYCPEGSFLKDGRAVVPAEQPAVRALIRTALLCNDAELRQLGGDWKVDGDPMEGALLTLAAKAGMDILAVRGQLPRTGGIPFDAAHRFMATLHRDGIEGTFACIKGAPERVLAMCNRQRGPAGGTPLDLPHWHAAVDALGATGRRVLAFATKSLPAGSDALQLADVEGGAELLGLIGLIDPPREEAIAAVRDCVTAGIRTIMITGDHAATSAAIATQLGLGELPPVVTGQMLDGLGGAELRTLCARTTVFARTTPEQKLRLVEALQADGAVVAMTGDGVNDAPALRRADVGVAMGSKGTEAAKEAAEIVLADDNFASIVAAVREGRTVHDNLRKVIAWTLPTNGGEVFAIIVAILLGLTLPITALQILWINMITSVTLDLPLAFEPAEPGTMRRPPRAPDAPLVSTGLAWQIAFVSIVFACGVFGAFYLGLARDLPLEAARTLAVNSLVAMEIAYLFNVRYVHGTSLSWRGMLGTPAVLISLIIVTTAQLGFTYLPFMQTAFQSRPLGLADVATALGAGVVVFTIVELEKRLRLGRRGPVR